MFKHSVDTKSWATLCAWPVCLNFGCAKAGASCVQQPHRVPVWTGTLWSRCSHSSCWSRSVVHVIYNVRETAVTPSSRYRCFSLLSQGKTVDIILGKGGAAKSFMLIYERCLLSAQPFEYRAPLFERMPSKIKINVILSSLFPFKISPSGDV